MEHPHTLKEKQQRMGRLMERHKRIRIWEVCSPLPRGEAMLLSLICDHGQAVKVSEIARKVGIPMSAVSRSLGKLEDAGYVERNTDRKDRRSILVEPTARGLELNRACMERFLQISDQVLSRYSDEAFDSFLTNWESFTSYMEEAVETAAETEKKGEEKTK